MYIVRISPQGHIRVEEVEQWPLNTDGIIYNCHRYQYLKEYLNKLRAALLPLIGGVGPLED